ncbi:class I SAM-dependent methyltransferase [Phormidesmis priestleyi]
MTQLHRLWVTTQAIEKHLQPTDCVLNLGAYPFAQEILLRDCLDFKGAITSTINFPFWKSALEEVASYQIDCVSMNLDPFMQAMSSDDRDQFYKIDPTGKHLSFFEMLSPDYVFPTRLPLEDSSVDFAIFAHVIEHLYHPLDICKQINRVLKPGGKLLISTDNAFRLESIIKALWVSPYFWEPVQQTSAMYFSFWRGHNRFFTSSDLSAMLSAVELHVIETHHEILYNSLSADFFKRPTKSFPAWRAELVRNPRLSKQDYYHCRKAILKSSVTNLRQDC